MDICYSPKELDAIEQRVREIKDKHPKMSDRHARVHEVISRYEGENGLSPHGVDYLTSCIMALDYDR